MKHPPWYNAELDELARRVHHDELDLTEAIAQLSDRVIDKDADLMRAFVTKCVTDELTAERRRLAQRAAKEVDRKVAEVESGAVQSALPGIDEQLSYFFPMASDSTPLTENGAYAYDLLGRAERHHKVAKARVALHERIVAAVGGNADGKATFGQGKAALRASAAEG